MNKVFIKNALYLLPIFYSFFLSGNMSKIAYSEDTLTKAGEVKTSLSTEASDTHNEVTDLGKKEEPGAEDVNEAQSSITPTDSHTTKNAVRITIEELIDIALANNYDLRIKQKEAETAFYEYLKIKGEAGLSLDFTSSITRSGPLVKFKFDAAGSETTFQKEVISRSSLRLSYPLTPLGNLSLGEKAAEANYLARQGLVDKEVASAITETYQGYKSYLIAEQGVALAEEALVLAEEQLKNATLRFEEGISPRFEVIQGEVAVSEAKENLISAYNTLALARSSLFLTVGIDPSNYFNGADVEITYDAWVDSLVKQVSEVVLPRLDVQALTNYFLESTPDFRFLKSNILSLEAQLGARKRSPILNLTASYTHQSGSSFQKSNTWEYGLSGTFNLFDSGKTENWLRAIKAQKEQFELSLERYKQAFELSITDKKSQLESAVYGWQTAKNTLSQAEEALRMSRIGYEEGVVTHADLVSSRTAYLSAKLREFSQRLEILSAYHSLLREIGMTDASLYLPKDVSDFYWIPRPIEEGQSEQNS